MTGRTTEEEFRLSAEEFVRTYNAFEKAAKRFLAASAKIREEKPQKSIELSEKIKSIREFLVQIEDRSGHMEKLSFGLRYTGEGEKEEEYNIKML